MTVERFLEKYDYDAKPMGCVSNKVLSKVFKQYKYIDVREYWFDDSDNPEDISWEDIEGIGYGWLWLNYYKKKNKGLRYKALRKHLCKWATRFHRNEPVWKSIYKIDNNDVISYLWSLDDEIIVVNLSNTELNPF